MMADTLKKLSHIAREATVHSNHNEKGSSLVIGKKKSTSSFATSTVLVLRPRGDSSRRSWRHHAAWNITTPAIMRGPPEAVQVKIVGIITTSQMELCSTETFEKIRRANYSPLEAVGTVLDLPRSGKNLRFLFWRLRGMVVVYLCLNHSWKLASRTCLRGLE